MNQFNTLIVLGTWNAREKEVKCKEKRMKRVNEIDNMIFTYSKSHLNFLYVIFFIYLLINFNHSLLIILFSMHLSQVNKLIHYGHWTIASAHRSIRVRDIEYENYNFQENENKIKNKYLFRLVWNERIFYFSFVFSITI